MSRGATLAAAVVVSRIIDPSSFGRLTVIQAAVIFAVGIAGLGIGVAVTKAVSQALVEDREAAGALLGGALRLTAIASLGITIAWVIALGPLGRTLLQTDDAETVLLLAAPAVGLGALIACAQGGLLGLEAFRIVALAQVAQGTLTASGLALGALIADLDGAVAGFSAANALVVAITLGLLRREASARQITIRADQTRTAWRTLWPLAGPALAASLVVATALLAGQLLLSRQPGGYEEVATFNLAYRWHLAIAFIPAVMTPAMLPVMTRLLAQRRADEAHQLFSANLVVTAVITVPPALLLVIAASTLMGLSGAYYADHADVLMVLALAAIPSAWNNVLSWACLSAGRIRLWLASDVVLALGILGTAALLVPTELAVGLAIAVLIGFLLNDALLFAGLSGKSIDRGHEGRD